MESGITVGQGVNILAKRGEGHGFFAKRFLEFMCKVFLIFGIIFRISAESRNLFKSLVFKSR